MGHAGAILEFWLDPHAFLGNFPTAIAFLAHQCNKPPIFQHTWKYSSSYK